MLGRLGLPSEPFPGSSHHLRTWPQRLSIWSSWRRFQKLPSFAGHAYKLWQVLIGRVLYVPTHARTGSSRGSGRAMTGPVEKGTLSLPSSAVNTLMTVSASRKPSISLLPTEPQVLRSRYWDVTKKRTENAALGEALPPPMPFCHISCNPTMGLIRKGVGA